MLSSRSHNFTNNFRNRHFAGDDLSNRVFSDCDFYKADFCEVYGHDCIIKNSSMSHANLELADFTGTEFIDVDFTGTNFEAAKFNDCVFRNCTITAAQFPLGLFRSVEFNGAIFENTDISECHFWVAIFSRLTIQNMAFVDIRMLDVIELRKVILESVIFEQVDFTGSTKPISANNIICRGKNTYDNTWLIRPPGWPE